MMRPRAAAVRASGLGVRPRWEGRRGPGPTL